MMEQHDEPKGKKQSNWYWITACALGGAAAGYIGADLITGGANGQPLLDTSFSESAAIVVAAILLICVLIVAIGFLFPKIGMTMSMFEDTDQWEDERGMMLHSVIGGSSYAIALILLALAEPFSLSGNVPVLIAIGLLLTAFLFTCWRLLSVYDELWQGVNSDTCSYGFCITFLVGGLWSIGSHLGFLVELSALDWITLLTVAGIAGTMIAAQRRGMLDR